MPAITNENNNNNNNRQYNDLVLLLLGNDVEIEACMVLDCILAN